jgi:glycosyltransferase involved in cell wall biosynthesis
MIIAFSFFNYLENENDDFLCETLAHISKIQSDATFIFISNKNWERFSLQKNIIPVVVNSEIKNLFPGKFLFDFTISRILKKYKADIFITRNYCSLFTKVPQILTNPASGALGDEKSIAKKESFFKNLFISKSLRQAQKVITFSGFEKEQITKKYKTDPAKIEVIYFGVNNNNEPIDFGKREKVKEEYADGNEFFLHAENINEEKNLMNLLKAFSAFKKRQRSKMQLLFIEKSGTNATKFKNSLRSYKFRNEIKIWEDLPQKKISEINSSAYAVIDPEIYSVNFKPILASMNTNIPLLLSAKGGTKEICEDGAIYFNAESYKDIAEKMMLIFKDETLRSAMINKAAVQIKKFNWEKSSFALWAAIQEIISNK